MDKSGRLELANQTLESYLKRLASSDSTPGGGTAAGFAGAQAAALLSMVCNLSQGEKFAAAETAINEIERLCINVRVKLFSLCVDDIRVFDGVMAAYRLPKNTPGEKEVRRNSIQQSLEAAARVPLVMMEQVSSLLPLADRLARIGNPNLISDVGVAMHLIEASLASARLNVLINARHITDADTAKTLRNSVSQLVENLAALKPDILTQVEAGIS